MQKEPRALKSKEELISDLKNNQDFQKKIKFTREKFYPALLKANPTIEDASTWLSGFNTALMQEFLSRMKDVKMSELKLGLKLEATSDQFLQFQELVLLFDDMTVFEAKDHIEGLRGEIDLWKQDENRERKLSDLKVKWIDDL